MARPTNEPPTCQICGGVIRGQSYNWDDNPRLPMHKLLTQCEGNGVMLFANFMNRNVEYINGRGGAVLLSGYVLPVEEGN